MDMELWERLSDDWLLDVNWAFNDIQGIWWQTGHLVTNTSVIHISSEIYVNFKVIDGSNFKQNCILLLWSSGLWGVLIVRRFVEICGLWGVLIVRKMCGLWGVLIVRIYSGLWGVLKVRKMCELWGVLKVRIYCELWGPLTVRTFCELWGPLTVRIFQQTSNTTCHRAFVWLKLQLT